MARPLDKEEPRLTVRHVRAAVDEPTALGLLSEGFWRRVLDRLRGDGVPVKAECIWAPAYLVTIPMMERGTAVPFVCTVDALGGAFALFGMAEAIVSGEPAGERLAPILSAEEADRIARAALVAAMLRRRRKSATAQLGETASVELLRWPYWVFYHRRRSGAMNIRVLDAATGGRVGRKIVLGLLNAFRATLH